MLPPALLCAALGLALSVTPHRMRLVCAALAVTTACTVVLIPIPAAQIDFAFLGCWISVMLCAATVHARGGIQSRFAVALSLNDGLWVGAVISLAGTRFDLLKALPFVLVFIPASWIVHSGGALSLKVLSSWLIAVALLAAILQFLPVTPGYIPDHME